MWKPTNKSKRIAIVFRYAAKQALGRRSTAPKLVEQINADLKKIGGLEKGYGVYTKLFKERRKANQIVTLAQYDQAWNAVAEWLAK